MDRGVGTILQQARLRRQVALEDVEAKTRIRLRFLRAIENEEWDVLPGDVYTRGFIRAYAAHLGLDGERLAADYRESVESERRGSEPPAAPPKRSRYRSSSRGAPVALRGLVAVIVVIAVAAIAIVTMPSGGDGDGGPKGDSQPPRRTAVKKAGTAQKPRQQGVSLSLTAVAEVWVCVLDADEEPLVDGQILGAGAKKGPLRSGSFTVSFGNGGVSMLIDGREADIPETASPIGFSIDPSGSLTELSETQRPTCT